MDERKRDNKAIKVGLLIIVITIIYFALIKPALETGQIQMPTTTGEEGITEEKPVIEEEKKSEMISVTAYRCDEATRTCKVLTPKPLSMLSIITSPTGTVEGVTHFRLEIVAGPVKQRNINNFRIMRPNENPRTTNDYGGNDGTSTFYEALKNWYNKPLESGPINIGSSYKWDSGRCNPADSDCNQNGYCKNDYGCDWIKAGEECYTVGQTPYCLIPAADFEGKSPDDTYKFTAAIEGAYTTSQGTEKTVSNTGTLTLTITPEEDDLTGEDIFSVSVSEAVI